MSLMSREGPGKEVIETRILVALEPRYRVYQSAIASVLQEFRPHIEVATAEPGEFEAEVARFDPDLIIYSRPNAVPPNSRPAWIEFLFLDPDLLAVTCLDGEYSESNNPGINELLSIVDEAEKLARTKRDLGNC
jgi:hypothetical protein